MKSYKELDKNKTYLVTGAAGLWVHCRNYLMIVQ